jgi:hypothetical protein
MTIWKDLIDYEGFYEVSDSGLIRSVDRIDSIGRFKKGKVLNGGLTTNGYMYFVSSVNGVTKNILWHRAILCSFYPQNLKLEVNHINGIKSDNRLCNLEWMTRSENIVHARKIGLSKACYIERKVKVTDENGCIYNFKTMASCSKFFGKSKTYMHGLIGRFGCEFEFKGYTFEVEPSKVGVRC